MKPVKLEGFRTVRQTEGHTCGYCAVCAVYRYYGLDTRKLRLRERLGTDNSLPYNTPLRDKIEAFLHNNGLEGLRGTNPMDILATLYWHGFDSACKVEPYDDYRPALQTHLKSGHPALVLSLSGEPHWVVVTGMDDGGVWIADSSGYLDPDGRGRHRYRLTHDDFGSAASGVVLVKRGKRACVRDMTAANFAYHYARGAGFGLACVGKSVPTWISRLLSGLE